MHCPLQVNPSTVDWPLQADLSGTGFSGPETIVAKALATTCYSLTFNPKKEGQVEVTDMPTHTHTHTHTHACTHARTHACTHARVCTHACTHTHSAQNAYNLYIHCAFSTVIISPPLLPLSPPPLLPLSSPLPSSPSFPGRAASCEYH